MRLADLTTLRVGGEAGRLTEPTTREELIARVQEAWASGEEWLILGGGSNLVVSDDGFDGAVIRVATRGIERVASAEAGRIRLRVAAGEAWDDVVAYAVANGWAGLETLSGIPGLAGAAPIQNIGAYGTEVGDSLVGIEFFDYLSGEVVWLPTAELSLGYRTSTIKQGREGVVLSIELDLDLSELGVAGLGDDLAPSAVTPPLSAPIAYDQLAAALGIELGQRAPLAEVRNAVLALRAAKGMLWHLDDADARSAGSFFTNPIVSENFARSLPAGLPRWWIEVDRPDVAVPLGDEPPAPSFAVPTLVKLSAAWLIENAGVARGFSLPGSKAAISSKHTLAIVNRGGASAGEIVELARFVQTRVYAEFGVRLQAEPVLIGIEL